MADFSRPFFEKLQEINATIFFQTSNGFFFRKDQTLIKKSVMARKIQNGSQKSRWRQMYIFFIKKSIGTPPIMKLSNYFLMQNVEY
jgi:hypothetical protein